MFFIDFIFFSIFYIFLTLPCIRRTIYLHLNFRFNAIKKKKFNNYYLHVVNTYRPIEK